MNTVIHAKLGEVPTQFQSHAERRIRRMLRRWRRRVTQVRVFLKDEDGPRGGPGIRCRVVLDTGRGFPLVATARGREVEDALSGALVRARDRVRRHEQRRVARLRARAERRDLRQAA